jgi:hypothetical protein
MGLDRVLTRRQLLRSIPALAVAPLASRAFAQVAPGAIKVTGINHVTLSVSDVKRSVTSQGLFGMPRRQPQGMTNLQIAGQFWRELGGPGRHQPHLLA